MASAGSYPARELKRLKKEWVRRNAKMVAILFVGVVVLGVLANLMVAGIPMPIRLYVLGIIHAGLIATAVYLINLAFLANSQAAIQQIRGVWGEDNTRSELQRAKRKRLIWDWVDSVQLQFGDIDHVVVTRRGGVVVLDSKWRNQIASEDVRRMAESARKAAMRAEGVLGTVLKQETGARHRTSAKPVTVTAAVVLWGAARASVPSGATIDGVRFLDGRELLGWLAGLEAHEVPREAARDVVTLLDRFCSQTSASSS